MPLRELSFVSTQPITSLPYFRYRVRLNAAVDAASLPGELGKLTSSLKWKHKVAILSDPSNAAILSPVPLSSQDDRYTILAQEQIDLASQHYEHFLFQVCNFALFKAFENAKNPPRIDRILKRIYSPAPSANLSANQTSNLIEGQRYLTFDFIRDWHQHLVLILDFASQFYSRLTLEELGIENLKPGDRLVHTYDGKVCEFLAIGQATINTPLVELGNNSLVQYHLQKDNLTEQLINSLNLSTPVLMVRYSSGNKDFDAPHMPQLLRQLYDREDVDNDLFNEQIWPIAEKVTKAIQSVQFLNTKNRFNLSNYLPVNFSTSLRETQNLQHFTEGKRSKNLDFGQRAIAGKSQPILVAYPTAGVGNYHLLEKPAEIKAAILYPQPWESQALSYTEALKKEMDRFGINLKRFSQPYDPHNQIQIREICQNLKKECEFVIAYVPKPGEEYFTREVNPYKLIKRQLVLRKLPSQMITKSTLNRRWNDFIVRNIILGINAKLGYLSWRLNEMPGTAQAFIGLDIGRKDNVAVGASAFFIDASGQMIGWSNAQFQAFRETFDREKLKNLLMDLVSLYRHQFHLPLQHLVIHRDGKVQDEEFQAISELKTQLADEGLKYLDVVEVIKSGTCRAVLWNPESVENPYTNPQKGWGWEHCRHEAVILTTGDREAKVSPNSSPRPLRIRRRLGETDLLTLAEQVYWLSEMQVGTTQTIRLPITTYYADRAAEFALEGLIPVGIQQDKCLWFL
ncbi:Piwi domain-containing protein [Aerosakkonema funiforme]|uniref:Piwi domain-containing protein n=1 Tax=Aerosakkonema funiforme TaxID=1246630 RepID=UPI0035B9BDD9